MSDRVYRESADIVRVLTPVGQRTEFPLKPRWLKPRHAIVVAVFGLLFGISSVAGEDWTSANELRLSFSSVLPGLPFRSPSKEVSPKSILDQTQIEALVRVRAEAIWKERSAKLRSELLEELRNQPPVVEASVPIPAPEPATTPPPEVTASPPNSPEEESSPPVTRLVTPKPIAPTASWREPIRRLQPKPASVEIPSWLGLSEKNLKCLQDKKFC
jgi:hypothetical protein